MTAEQMCPHPHAHTGLLSHTLDVLKLQMHVSDEQDTDAAPSMQFLSIFYAQMLYAIFSLDSGALG